MIIWFFQELQTDEHHRVDRYSVNSQQMGAVKLFQFAVKLFQFAVKLFQIAVELFQFAVKLFQFAVKLFQLAMKFFQFVTPNFLSWLLWEIWGHTMGESEF